MQRGHEPRSRPPLSLVLVTVVALLGWLVTIVVDFIRALPDGLSAALENTWLFFFVWLVTVVVVGVAAWNWYRRGR